MKKLLFVLAAITAVFAILSQSAVAQAVQIPGKIWKLTGTATSPEAVVEANSGDFCTSISSDSVWVKTGGESKVGWVNLMTSGTAAMISGTIPATQVSGLHAGATSGTSAMISGTLPAAQVSGLNTVATTGTGTGLVDSGTFQAVTFKSGASVGVSGTYAAGTNFVVVGGIVTGTAP
jgi:hypothetical protein